jgi:N-dimethylarginine dimethylaminohydrolase
MTAPLRRVLVRPPGADLSRWREYGWRAEPDAARIAEEHKGLCAALQRAGAEVVVGEPPADGNVDAMMLLVSCSHDSRRPATLSACTR